MVYYRELRDLQMNSITLRNLVRPLYTIVPEVFSDGITNAMAAIRIMGHARKTERANVIHACIRESWRVVCDVCEPFLELVEEPDGFGLDAVVIDIDGARAALRWGRYDPNVGVIRRNKTLRAESSMQGYLFGDFFDPQGLPTGTMAFELEDDFHAAGEPQWWMSRIVLRRERIDATEFIEEVRSYTNPLRIADLPEPRTVEYLVTSTARLAQIEQMAQHLRGEIA